MIRISALGRCKDADARGNFCKPQNFFSPASQKGLLSVEAGVQFRRPINGLQNLDTGLCRYDSSFSKFPMGNF